MARTIEAYVDDRGHLHTSPSTAVVADIAAILGRVGDEGGMTSGVTALILEKREAIEQRRARARLLVVTVGLLFMVALPLVIRGARSALALGRWRCSSRRR